MSTSVSSITELGAPRPELQGPEWRLAEMALKAVIESWGDVRGYSFSVNVEDGEAIVTVRKLVQHGDVLMIEDSVSLSWVDMRQTPTRVVREIVRQVRAAMEESR